MSAQEGEEGVTTKGSFLLGAARCLVRTWREAERIALYIEWTVESGQVEGHRYVPVTGDLLEAVQEVEAMIRDFNEVLAEARKEVPLP